MIIMMSSAFDDWQAFPDFVTLKIFNYLSYDDLFLSASLVNKNWYFYIGSTSECMNKVRLKIEGWHDLEYISEFLSENSSRIYKNLLLHNLNPEKEFSYLALRDWSEVKLSQMKFVSATQLYNYVCKFGDELKTLDMERIVIIRSDELCEKSLNLPQLKRLRLKQVPTAAFQVFQSYPNIKKLEFDIPAFGSKRRTDITDFFVNFRDVNLEELVICRNSLYGLSIETHRLMESIIVSMRNSLKRIELKRWGFSHTLEEIWNGMKVSYFSIDVCSQIPLLSSIINLSPNMHLKTLKISSLFLPKVQWFKTIFMLSPQLSELYISIIRKEAIYYAAHILNDLRLFSYKSCIIEVAKDDDDNDDGDDNDNDEFRNEYPGKNYKFIGKNEIFSVNDEAEEATESTTLVRKYSDEHLDIDFGVLFYEELKFREFVNQKIKIIKCADCV